jgi:hypothetical protein
MNVTRGASGVKKLGTYRMTARNDDRRIGVTLKADTAFKRVMNLQPLNHLIREVSGAFEEVVLRDVLGGRLAEIFNEIRVAAGLAQTEQKNQDACVVG